MFGISLKEESKHVLRILSKNLRLKLLLFLQSEKILSTFGEHMRTLFSFVNDFENGA